MASSSNGWSYDKVSGEWYADGPYAASGAYEGYQQGSADWAQQGYREGSVDWTTTDEDTSWAAGSANVGQTLSSYRCDYHSIHATAYNSFFGGHVTSGTDFATFFSERS